MKTVLKGKSSKKLWQKNAKKPYFQLKMDGQVTVLYLESSNKNLVTQHKNGNNFLHRTKVVHTYPSVSGIRHICFAPTKKEMGFDTILINLVLSCHLMKKKKEYCVALKNV